MKVGFTAAETHSLFRSLRREVFNYFGYERPLSFGVRTQASGLFDVGEIAFCDYSTDPDNRWAPPSLGMVATGIRVDAMYLPHLYEDEMLNLLLHELCHATAGWSAAHGDEWKAQAEQVGAIPHDTFIPRAFRDLFEEGSLMRRVAEREGPTMPKWV